MLQKYNWIILAWLKKNYYSNTLHYILIRKFKPIYNAQLKMNMFL